MTKNKDFTKNKGATSSPIYNLSTVIFPSLRDYLSSEKGIPFYEESNNSFDYSYGTSYNPTVFSLQEKLAELENAEHALILPSGLSALTTAITAILQTGDHILLPDHVYSPTKRFCQDLSKRWGVELTYYPSDINSSIVDYFKSNTKILFMESPGTWTFEVQDIPRMCSLVKEYNENIVTMFDNSWATPLLFRPLENGVDVSIQALTKYISGHSDVILGAVTCNDDKHYKKIFRCFHNTGNKPSAYECFLAERGLKTLALRLKKHEENAYQIAKMLERHPKVSKILHPAFEDCMGHNIWQRDFKGSTGLFSITLDKKYPVEQLSNFIDNLEYFNIGASWGGANSLILSRDIYSTRLHKGHLQDHSIVRIYAGLEDYQILIDDLLKGLDRL